MKWAVEGIKIIINNFNKLFEGAKSYKSESMNSRRNKKLKIDSQDIKDYVKKTLKKYRQFFQLIDTLIALGKRRIRSLYTEIKIMRDDTGWTLKMENIVNKVMLLI